MIKQFILLLQPKATEAKPGKPASIVERIKKRMALLEEQVKLQHVFDDAQFKLCWLVNIFQEANSNGA